MRRPSLRHLPAAALLALAAACADEPAGPAPMGVPEAAPLADVVIETMTKDSTSASFTLTPSGGVFRMGPHYVYFPANSVCDPSSSYGVTEWDKPCRPLTAPIRFTAQVYKSGKAQWVYFTPNIRFVPTTNQSGWVWLYMKVDAGRRGLDPSRYSLLWYSAPGAAPIDESVTDPTLRTLVWPEESLIFRRIKHFSGYQVHDGYVEEIDALPGGLTGELDGLTTLSGTTTRLW
jgi:hypothetical protein